MSELFSKKIEGLKSLDERERTVLNYIMVDKEVKVTDIANQMSIGGSKGIGESTVRAYLTGIFKKLGVPNNERDKRGWIIREYSRAYANLYLKVEIPPTKDEEPEIKETQKPTPSSKEIYESLPPEFSKDLGGGEPRRPERRINVPPPPARTNVSQGMIGAFVLIAIIAIVVLVVVLSNLNQPSAPTNNPSSQSPSGLHGWYDEIYLKDGVKLYGSSVGGTVCSDQESFDMDLQIRNDSGSDFSWAVSTGNFSLVDSNGKSYNLISAYFAGPTPEYNRDIHSGYTEIIITCWAGRSPSETGANYFDLTVKNYPGLYDIVFRKTR